MELKSLHCPNCGGLLDVEDGLDVFFCKYCGYKVVLTGLSDEAYKSKVKLKEFEYEKEAQERKIQNDQLMWEKQYQKDKLRWEQEEKAKAREYKRERAKERRERSPLVLFAGFVILYFVAIIFWAWGGLGRIRDFSRVKELKELSSEIEECIDDEDFDEAQQLNEKLRSTVNELEYDENASFWDGQYDEYRLLIEYTRRDVYDLDPIRITMTQGSRVISQMSPEDAEDYLYDLGFLEVTRRYVETGFFTRSQRGEVESVSIDGDKSFDSGDCFYDEDEVILFIYED